MGRIWATGARQFVDRSEVEKAALAADFVLLGEKHDNADHHLLQAQMIKSLIAGGKKPAVIMEMIDEDKQPELDKWRLANPKDGSGLAEAVNWAKSGWPDWPTYQPIADAAVEAALPIRAGNLPRKKIRIIGRKGLGEIVADRRERLGLNTPVGEKVADQIRQDLFEAHCKLMPLKSLSPLINVQRARDAILADNLASGLKLSKTNTSVLVAGGGHVRNDYAVPVYLKSLRKDPRIFTVAFIEVAVDKDHPKDYSERFGSKFPFDYVWFTPRWDNKDHCAELKKRFSKYKRKKK